MKFRFKNSDFLIIGLLVFFAITWILSPKYSLFYCDENSNYCKLEQNDHIGMKHTIQIGKLSDIKEFQLVSTTQNELVNSSLRNFRLKTVTYNQICAVDFNDKFLSCFFKTDASKEHNSERVQNLNKKFKNNKSFKIKL